MALKLQQFLFVVISTFLATCAVMFGGSAVNFFELSWNTWTILISSVIVGVLNYCVMWLAPQNKNFGLGSK
jgi:hypothetical protein